MTAVTQTVNAILKDENVYQAIKFVSEKETVTATIRRYKRRSRNRKEIILTIGKPNRQNRLFLKRVNPKSFPYP